MEYDPKGYYPGGWKEENGKRRKVVYSWEGAVSEADARLYDLAAINLEENDWFAVDLDKVTDEAAQFLEEGKVNTVGTRKHRTQGGGFHWIFEVPDGVEIPRRIGFVPGIDLLGGGMLFAMPSPGYELREGDDVLPPPPELLDLIRKIEDSPRPESEAGMGGDVIEGGRNQAMFNQGMALRKRHNLDQRDIESCLLRENQERCKPPLSAAEILQIASSVASYDGSLSESLPDADESEFKAMTITELHSFAATLPPVEQVCGPFQTGTWGIVYGAPGAGKSRFVQAMGLHIAAGERFFRWAVPKPRGVYYLDAEMSVYAVLERAAQWKIRPDSFVYDLLQLREAHGLPGFELGSEQHTEWLKRAVGDAEVVILDNVESTLIPHKDGIYSSSTWSQTQPLRDWIMTTNKLLLFVDHPNKHGAIAGTESKRRGSWLNMRLVRESEPGDDDKLLFTTELTKPARNNLDRDQIAKYEWRVDAGDKWHQNLAQTDKERAQELRSQGVKPKDIALVLGHDTDWVYRHTRK